jgi:membrane protein YqaA with SNARE-associated domain
MPSEGWVAWVISWASTPYGGAALFLNAVAESSFSPFPPDVLLIALSILRPPLACGYAAICSLGSVLDGVLGCFLGLKGGRPLLQRLISEERIRFVERYYQKYDIWAVGIAGFTPIPYKAFTISAGVFVLDLKRFILVSVISRSARFFSGRIHDIHIWGDSEALSHKICRYVQHCLCSLIDPGICCRSLFCQKDGGEGVRIRSGGYNESQDIP